MTRIKICGITDLETASFCARLGVDFIGLVFAESRRRVTPEQALDVTINLLASEERPKLCGVFVNEPADEVNRIAEYCHLDLVQLSGDKDDDYCQRIRRPLIRASPINQTSTIEEIQCRFAANNPGIIYLLDHRSAGMFGGSGERFDWKILGGLNPAVRVMVAGGLTPENVEELILSYHPWGVDISSGVETNSRKDPAKILAFVQGVREADAKLKGVKDAAR